MIRANELSLRRGSRLLLQTTDFVIHPGERVGIVGSNGAGKSSLFALLRGELEQDAGTLEIPADWRMACVEQSIAQSDQPAREFVIDGDQHLRSLQAQRAALAPDQGHAIAELELALNDAEAWSAAARAEQLLAGLGFSSAQWMAPVRSFSGGWQMRLALAQALMMPSELLLLDEPTNHLDLDAMLWLERWINGYRGTVLVISHDTEFLDSVAQVILHFEQGKLRRYSGNYQSFLEQRTERLRQNQQAIKRQEREAAHLQTFIDRFRAKASKARQAQSRIKALARMQTLTPLLVESGVQIRLPEPEHSPDLQVQLRNACLGYPGSNGHAPIQVLHDVDVQVRGGDRIGILGANGAGKSTLIKTLAGQLQALQGKATWAQRLVAGYFAQQQLDMLEPQDTALQHFQKLAPQAREQDLRDMLGAYGFSADMLRQTVATFSGGEKARLAFALIAWHKPNLLLLDEPSNHLDLDTREALARALTEYSGSMLLVSHDRHLLRSTVDRFWIVADGTVQEFDGDLDDYRQWLQSRQSRQKATDRIVSPAPDRRAERRQQAELRQALARQRKPLQAKAGTLEKKMQALQSTISALATTMAEDGFYTDPQRGDRADILARHGALGKELSDLEEKWLEVQLQIETLEQEYSQADGD